MIRKLSIKNLGIKALKTPVRAPQANAYCDGESGSAKSALRLTDL